MRGLKVHKTGASMGLTVPQHIAKLIPENARFEVELVEEGILYRLLPPEEPIRQIQLPAWVHAA